MNINRHNYEAFFLLYVDNELSAQERVSVEQFVSQNADLKSELDLLQMSVIGIDECVFEEKNSLFKKEEGISITNYENYFLLSVDNELNDEEKTSVEKFVLKHPALQNEFTFLQKTKLPAEHVPYKNKEELYRKERRVVPLLWMRMSIAAAIVGVIAFSWIAINQLGDKEANNLVANASQKTGVELPKAKAKDSKKLNTVSTPKMETKESNGVVKNEPKNIAPDNKENKKQIGKEVESATAKSIIKNVEKVELPEVGLAKNVVVENKTIPIISEENKRYEKLPLETIPTGEKATNVAVANTIVSNTKSSIVTQAAYKEIDTNTDDDKALYIGSIKINKNKLKGIFKKATSLFGKRDTKEPNEKSTQVANFEIRST